MKNRQRHGDHLDTLIVMAIPRPPAVKLLEQVFVRVLLERIRREVAVIEPHTAATTFSKAVLPLDFFRKFPGQIDSIVCVCGVCVCVFVVAVRFRKNTNYLTSR
jgi:hypothetical protein